MQDLTRNCLTKVIQPRPAESHKGTYGHVAIIAGNEQYGGAGILSASAATYSGAGLVSLISDIVNQTAMHSRLPEVMFINWQNQASVTTVIKQANTIVIGPGLGLDDWAEQLLAQTLAQLTSRQVVIIDGSALTLLAHKQQPIHTLAQVILTPHQVEWQRLSGLSLAEQTITANQKALNILCPHAILVLKQHRTQIYADQAVYRNTTGSPAMATGGMGDTLTGIIAAFCAQFKKPLPATLAAVYLHGLAGTELGQQQYVVLPSQLITLIPKLMCRFTDLK